MVDYTEIPGLEHFVLEESYVLSITEAPGSVQIELDLVLAKDHPDLLPARAGEWAYFRTGVITFDGVTEFSWENRTAPAEDSDGTFSWSGIDSFTEDGDVYLLGGDPGDIRIVAEAVRVEFTGPA